MPDIAQRPPFSHCVVEEWPLRTRLEALTVSVNTLSVILILHECGSEPRAGSDIYARIATGAFGTAKDEFDAIGYGTIRSELKGLADTFSSLIRAFE